MGGADELARQVNQMSSGRDLEERKGNGDTVEQLALGGRRKKLLMGVGFMRQGLVRSRGAHGCPSEG